MVVSDLVAEQISEATPYTCYVFPLVSSTQDVVAEYPIGTVCCADEQTAGRGRRYSWYSPAGENILLSLSQRFSIKLEGLTLQIALAVIKTLEHYGISGLQVKWPNDVWVSQRKIAGILLESKVQGQNTEVIIGIGLNINSIDIPEFEGVWTSMRREKNQHFNRTEVMITLLNEIEDMISSFCTSGIDHATWQKYDILTGQHISCMDPEISGKVLGINPQGHLRLQTAQGEVELVNAHGLRW